MFMLKPGVAAGFEATIVARPRGKIQATQEYQTFAKNLLYMGGARKPREAYQGCVHVAFTACVHGRKPVLTTPQVVDPLLSALDRACKETRCFVPIYCVMPDHLHVMFTGQNTDSDTWLAMVKFKGIHGKYLHATNSSWRWQSGFHDHVVRGARDWRGHARYIALNPVRAGLCDEVGEYPFVGTIGVEWSDLYWS